MSQIEYVQRATLQKTIQQSTTTEEWQELFEDMITILSGKAPTWRIERDPSIRGWHLTMSSEIPDAGVSYVAEQLTEASHS